MNKLITLITTATIAASGEAYAETRNLVEDLRKQKDILSFVDLPQNYQRNSILDRTPVAEYFPPRMSFPHFSLTVYDREYRAAIKTEQTTESIVIESYWSNVSSDASRGLLKDYIRYMVAEKKHNEHPHVEILRVGDAYLLVDNIPNGSKIIGYQKANPPIPLWQLSHEDEDNKKAMDELVKQYIAVYGLKRE